MDLNASDVQAITEQLRLGLVAKTPAVELTGAVEIDEVYVVAGHKGQPAAVAKRGLRDHLGLAWPKNRFFPEADRTADKAAAEQLSFEL